MRKGKVKKFSGWSGVNTATSHLYCVSRLDELKQVVKLGKVLARGSGMSFGDVSLNNNGNLIDMHSLKCFRNIEFDNEKGIVFCSAGVTQQELLDLVGPKGWGLPVIPGSARITLGGSVAADAHGKNHYLRGSISNHLIGLQVMLATGDIVHASHDNLDDLFRATTGGMGLTGVILGVGLKLKSIKSLYAIQEFIGFSDVDEMIDIIELNKNRSEYLLGWVDGTFKPGSDWQGAVSVGRNASINDVSDPWNVRYRKTIGIPFRNPLPLGGMLAGWMVNKAIGLKFRHGRKELLDFNRFYFPQDGVNNWNRAFGRAGFIDYQCCVPFLGCRDFLKEVHKFLNRHRIFCFLVAIKRFKSPEIDGPLTFARNGISIAFDIPVRTGIMKSLNSLDCIVIEFGGRVNLVKDSRLPQKSFRGMYPRFEEWKEIKQKYDPNEMFVSDLSRRLGLTEQ